MRLWTLRVVFALRRHIVHPRPDIFRRISSGQPIPIAWDWYIYLHEYGEIVWFSCGYSKYNYHGCYGIGMIKMHAKKHVWIHLVRCFLPRIFPSNWWRSFFGGLSIVLLGRFRWFKFRCLLQRGWSRSKHTQRLKKNKWLHLTKTHFQF